MKVNHSKHKNQDSRDRYPNTTEHHLSEISEEKPTEVVKSINNNPLNTIPAEDPQYTIDLIWGTKLTKEKS